MSGKILALTLALFLSLVSCSALIQPADIGKVTWTSREELLVMLDDPTLILLDARYGKDWRRSDRKIRNAERLDASEVDSWEGRYAPDQKIIIYCS
jgi:hypothetical protein